MSDIRVSVVIPTYNSAWSVGRTLLSVLNQRFPDFEVIVVNDGSTDAFDDAVAPYATDPRVRIVRQENVGLAASRNRGIAEARAPLIAPLDADDIWHPDFLAETVPALERNSTAPFAYSYSFRMDEDDYLFPYIKPEAPPRHDFIGLLSLNTVGSGSAAVYRRDLMMRVGGFDEEMGKRNLHGAEDWKMILRLARMGMPVFIERHLVGYRLVADSMSQHNPQRQFYAILAVLDDIRREMPDVARRALADGRTMMTAWLLPAFIRRGKFGLFLVQSVRAYLFNPLWFTNPLLRRAHIYRLQIVLGVVMSVFAMKEAEHPHLSEAEMEGERPFAGFPRIVSGRRHPKRPLLAMLRQKVAWRGR